MGVELTVFDKELYELFTFIRGNRRPKESYVKKLRRAIENNNGSIPQTKEWILTINGDSEIVDGQCHWAAIMQYNARHPRRPIQSISVVIEEGAGLERAKAINNNVRSKWKEEDYLTSYIDLGNGNYETLRRIRQTPESKACGLRITLCVCGYMADKKAYSKFMKGEFEMIREEPDAIDMLSRIAACKDAFKEFGDPTTARDVFMMCLLIPGIDKNRLTQRVSRPNVRLQHFRPSYVDETIAESMNAVYNARLNIADQINIAAGYRDVKYVNDRQNRESNQLPRHRIVPTETPPDGPSTPPDGPSAEAAIREEAKDKARQAAARSVRRAEEYSGQTPPTALSPHLGDNGISPV